MNAPFSAKEIEPFFLEMFANHLISVRTEIRLHRINSQVFICYLALRARNARSSQAGLRTKKRSISPEVKPLFKATWPEVMNLRRIWPFFGRTLGSILT